MAPTLPDGCSIPEQGTTDPDMCRTGRDRRRVVAAHPGRDGGCAGVAAPQLRGDLGEPRGTRQPAPPRAAAGSSPRAGAGPARRRSALPAGRLRPAARRRGPGRPVRRARSRDTWMKTSSSPAAARPGGGAPSPGPPNARRRPPGRRPPPSWTGPGPRSATGCPRAGSASALSHQLLHPVLPEVGDAQLGEDRDVVRPASPCSPRRA